MDFYLIVGIQNMSILNVLVRITLNIVIQQKQAIMHLHHSTLSWSYHNGKYLVYQNSINYFALRTLIKSYHSTRINTLAIYGLTISLISLPIIIYVPGI